MNEIIRKIELIEMRLAIIYDTGGTIQPHDMEALLKTLKELKSNVKTTE